MTQRAYSLVPKTHSRIDHILVSAPTLHKTLDCHIGDFVWSDHAPILLTLTEQFPRSLHSYFTTNVTPDTTTLTQLLAHKSVVRGQVYKPRRSQQTGILGPAPAATDTDGMKLYSPQHIAEELAKYYAELYYLKNNAKVHQATSVDISDFLAQIQLLALSLAQQQTLQAPITVDKILSTIAALPTGKSPGPDGLLNQYYKAHSRTQGPHLHNAFQAMLQESRLSAKVTLKKTTLQVQLDLKRFRIYSNKSALESLAVSELTILANGPLFPHVASSNNFSIFTSPHS
ncbi:phospholipid transfer [Pelobates cultripes]|uniref:Phospholipid transfer n=1 Tax=Pelobates cultripes TaxID=61616 RepID=A0AAD1R1M1_PELCU|nr:phospholipid transfer [Pelobates cultripes]